MGTSSRQTTRAWVCDHCGANNVTSATDVFADQCRDCTRYNDIDWTEDSELSVTEARTVASQMEAK